MMYNVNQINQAWDSINDLIPDLRKGKIKKKQIHICIKSGSVYVEQV